MKINIAELAEALNAELKGDRSLTVSHPLIDSRSLRNPVGVIFFALHTTTGNGHFYISDLYKRGVRAFVVEKGAELYDMPETSVLYVDDVFKALTDSAKYIRSLLKIPVVAITGSRAKTVVKEKLASLLQGEIKFARSPRSYNSKIGVPLSIWQVDDDSQALIIEAGVSEPGEMQPIFDIVRPYIGIFTSLTEEHAKAFISSAHKCKEKALLFAGCDEIIYPSENVLIGSVLKSMYPDKTLIAAESYDDMAVKAVSLVGVITDKRPAKEVSTRIDFVDTPDGYTIAYDNFTCDVQGIATGLDAVIRRLGNDEKLWIITDYETASDSYISKIFNDYGLNENVLTIDSEDFKIALANDIFYGCTLYINGHDKRKFDRLFSRLCGRGHVTRLEVNLDNLEHNLRQYRSMLPQSTGIIGMIKASAYGCGDIEVARSLQSNGAAMVAVAVADEGVALRKAGITLPIIVLDPWCENMRSIFAYNLEPTVIDTSSETLNRLDRAAAAEGVKSYAIHLKLDTGMHRVGIAENEIDEFAKLIQAHPNIRIASVFSHLATADMPQMDDYTELQIAKFERMSSKISKLAGYDFKRHILNTAGITRFGKTNVYELARLGIGLYGISPMPEIDTLNLKPVARLVTRIIRTHAYVKGETIGYGRRGVLARDSVIATLPIGYADGIDRRLGNGNARFMVNGQLCPTVGNICMDLCMIDITDCTDIGDGTVEIFGDNIGVQEVADILGTISYEVLTSISPRVKRIYFRE